MTTLLLLALLGGYAGCGDCCAKEPRPAECSCTCCGAERVPGCDLPPAFRKPARPRGASETDIINWCRESGLTVRLVWTLTGISSYSLTEIQCGEKPEGR